MQRRGMGLAWIISVIAIASGCGSEEREATVEEKCDALAAAVCDRYAQCGSSFFRSKAEADLFVTRCEPQARAMLECPTAVQVSASYDDCIEDLPTAACVIDVVDGNFTPGADVPVSCERVVSSL